MQRVWSTYLEELRARSATPNRMDNSSRTSLASQSTSTRHLTSNAMPLDPPNAPFVTDSSHSSLNAGFGAKGRDDSSVSLSVNYLPSKFSTGRLSPGPGVRRRKKPVGIDGIPKRGGGVEAFRSGEARMPGASDEDYDGVASGWFGKDGSQGKKKMRWTRFKWALFIANTLLSLWSLTALIFCLLVYFNVFDGADIVRVGNSTELALSMTCTILAILTSLVGWAGILLNNRAFLAVYTFMLWIVFAFMVAPGYITYKKRTFNLEGKINSQWSRDLGEQGRARIQNKLGCCGYFSPFVEATVTQTCYSRSVLPGCKLGYMEFERDVLQRWYTIAFALVPAQLFVMITALLSSNHVTYRFGKGMMPKRYRLSMNSMAVIMDNYATQLAEQYGSDVASEILARSRSNLHLDSYGSGGGGGGGGGVNGYVSVAGRD